MKRAATRERQARPGLRFALATGAADVTGAGLAAGSRGLAWLWLSAAVIALDQASKHLILAAFHPGQELALAPFMSLVLAFNSGAAFSFLAGAAGWQRWLFAAIAIAACVLMVWLLRRGGSALFCASLALIVGGALGNLWDRLTLGLVVDFLLFHYRHWYYPAFNVADSAISIGALALIVDSLRGGRSAAARHPAGDR
ncbi:MAG TPA: signal peptidase II [Casimicrobiaceae bacterium]|nr:signal peptidase II [Casimicrobiaceae bacterium]